MDDDTDRELSRIIRRRGLAEVEAALARYKRAPPGRPPWTESDLAIIYLCVEIERKLAATMNKKIGVLGLCERLLKSQRGKLRVSDNSKQIVTDAETLRRIYYNAKNWFDELHPLIKGRYERMIEHSAKLRTAE
jgi:hypothetical protein